MNLCNELFNRKYLWVLCFLCLVHVARTADALEKKAYSFAFLTDLHVSPDSENEKALLNVVDEINIGDSEFVVVTGDVTNVGSDIELKTVKSILDQLKKPYYIIPGNHETNWSESACQTFSNLWGVDRFVFTHDSTLFVGYNTGPFLKMGDGHVKAEDIIWLKKILKKKKGEYNAVVSLSHYPLRNDDLGNANEITNVLNKHNTLLSLCGHGHKLSLYNFNSIPGVMGRSLFVRNDELAGYNIVTLRSDSLYVHEKRLGKAKEKPFLSMKIGDASILKGIENTSLQKSESKSLKRVKVRTILNENASVFTGLAKEGDLVFYGTSKGELIGYNIRKKKYLWRNKISKGSVFSSPVVSNGIVVVGSVENKILAFDATSGKLIWEVKTSVPVINKGVIQDSNLYMGAGNFDFLKICLKTGKVLWKYYKGEGYFQAAPTVGEGKVIFGAWDKCLYCLDANTGEEIWKWRNPKSVTLYSPGNVTPVISHGKAYFVAPDRFLTALDLESGKQLWRNNDHRVRESMGISKDGSTVLMKTMDGQLLGVMTAVDEYTEKFCIESVLEYDHIPCNVASVGNMGFIGSRKGIVVAFDMKRGKVLWHYKGGNSSINEILIDENAPNELFVSLIEGKLLHFDLSNEFIKD
ncbi:outer membrane protein assembly factor BamB family protein [Marinifilum sp. D737]|uniref:outer membrane protein assembly factor BamB family protein n=1 Tax=Marinifilum sp. D737 TaxID=2969628 RepID=UPI0022753F80|nr:PQQ-binding-like beta-propeller repeat protein [Marinifilum sp. D737]MCY1636695.1 PQQ-binding-like beta-propeller repeat protein [Marinifilum sp. D737]